MAMAERNDRASICRGANAIHRHRLLRPTKPIILRLLEGILLGETLGVLRAFAAIAVAHFHREHAKDSKQARRKSDWLWPGCFASFDGCEEPANFRGIGSVQIPHLIGM